ncbi:MAG: PflD [Dehalococcoidia bacterium]|nr:PflD [Dehalococcoidia bacterium]
MSVMLKAMDWRKGMVTELGSTERVRNISGKFHSVRPSICLHRARAYTEVYRQTEGQPSVLRRAKALARTLEIMPAIISDDELIVGHPGCKPRSITVKPELHTPWLKMDIDKLDERDQDPYVVSDREKREFKEEIAPYWAGKTLYDKWKANCPEDIAWKVNGTGFGSVSSMLFSLGYHYNPDYAEIFKNGLNGYKEQARNKMAGLNPDNLEDIGKEHFYQAIILICDAIESYARKYATTAREQVQSESNPERKKELEAIAQICDNVPHNAPRNFHEAVQSLWFIETIAYIEGTGPVIPLGRFDQYMYPFYKKDIEDGRITREKAQELVECLWIKMNGLIWFHDAMTASSSAGYVPFNNTIVGGVDRYGNDATNELSYLCIDAMMETRTVQPNLSVMLHPKSPEELRLKVADLVALGLGHPSIYNLRTSVLSCMTLGYSLSESMNCYIKGCNEPAATGGMQYGFAAGGWCNLGMATEFVFTRGIKTLKGQKGSGKRIGVDTGDPKSLQTFESFYEAVKKQIEYQIKTAHIAENYVLQAAQGDFALLFESMLTKDCLDRGKDVLDGGARVYVGPGIEFVGIADVADSLAAVKKLVYEEKRVSMEDLCRALEANFEGYEGLRQLLLTHSPKYGNDVDYVDELAVEILDYGANLVWSLRSIYGNKNTPVNAPASANVPFGFPVGALPSGRKALEPLADGCSPAPGMDMCGPTAVIKSVTKLNHANLNGTLFNLWLSGISMSTLEGKRRFVELVRTYQDLGGHHVQVNTIAKETLRDAQKNPLKYPTLMVRVAGYSAYFIDLSKPVQDHIIARVEHNV